MTDKITASTAAARESARQSDGKFGEYARGIPTSDQIASVSAPCCAECGARVTIDENEVINHLDEDGNVDYDADADHVAIDDEQVEPNAVPDPDISDINDITQSLINDAWVGHEPPITRDHLHEIASAACPEADGEQIRRVADVLMDDGWLDHDEVLETADLERIASVIVDATRPVKPIGSQPISEPDTIITIPKDRNLYPSHIRDGQRLPLPAEDLVAHLAWLDQKKTELDLAIRDIEIVRAAKVVRQQFPTAVAIKARFYGADDSHLVAVTADGEEIPESADFLNYGSAMFSPTTEESLIEDFGFDGPVLIDIDKHADLL